MGKINYSIKSIPEEERPREKLLKHGAGRLSTSELLAIIIRTGSDEDTAISLSQKILTTGNKGLRNLTGASKESLMRFKGIGSAKAAEILASVELAKRISSLGREEKIKITSPGDISCYVMEEMRYLKKEHFRIIMLDTKNRIIDIKTVSIGNLNSSIVHPREVFYEAINRNAASIVLIHNHPSGDTDPSREDINITEKLIQSGKILGIEVLDHIIIGDGEYLSFKEKNLM